MATANDLESYTAITRAQFDEMKALSAPLISELERGIGDTSIIDAAEEEAGQIRARGEDFAARQRSRYGINLTGRDALAAQVSMNQNEARLGTNLMNQGARAQEAQQLGIYTALSNRQMNLQEDANSLLKNSANLEAQRLGIDSQRRTQQRQQRSGMIGQLAGLAGYAAFGPVGGIMAGTVAGGS